MIGQIHHGAAGSASGPGWLGELGSRMLDHGEPAAMTIEAGASATLDYEVGPEHTAAALGSGDMDVLATPQVLAWCEAATVAAVAPALGPDETTVGTHADLDHRRATAVGHMIRIDAVLTDVEDRRLTFHVEARDEAGEIATVRVVRVMVNRSRFMQRVAAG